MKQNNGLKIIHFNAQSMNPRNAKFTEIYNLLISSEVDIICISETWLGAHISDSSVTIPGFTIYRCDRLHRVGGGVAIYISDKIKSSLVCSKTSFGNVTTCFEFLAVRLVDHDLYV